MELYTHNFSGGGELSASIVTGSCVMMNAAHNSTVPSFPVFFVILISSFVNACLEDSDLPSLRMILNCFGFRLFFIAVSVAYHKVGGEKIIRYEVLETFFKNEYKVLYEMPTSLGFDVRTANLFVLS